MLKTRSLLRTFSFSLALLCLSSLASAQTVSSVVNAGDSSTAVSPGTIVAIRGANLAGTSLYASSLPLPTSLGDASVQFTAANGSTTALPLVLVSPTEIRAQLPYGLAGTTGRVSVNSGAAFNFTLSSISPRLITDSDGGPGDLVMYHADYSPISRENPARPGETVLMFAYGLGQTEPAATAGADPGFDPLRKVVAPVTVSFNGLQTIVNEAVLLPSNPGVYQISVRLPYDDRVGTVPVILTASGVSSQTNGVAPLLANGFYYQMLASSSPTPMGLNGLPGSSSVLATRHDDLAYWGANGFRNWSKNTGLPSQFEPIRGVAITLRNGDATVFSNHGIEQNNGAFYNNARGVPDGEKAGLLTIFSMSNLYNFVGGGFFRISQPVTFDTVMGYYDGNGDRDLPLDTSSSYIRYRMNIWSNVSGNAPSETGNFVGDVMSSDSTPGTWSWSYTGVDRIFRDTRTLNSDPARRDDPISRMVYKLNQPITLPAGDYWFSHDAIVPAVGAFGFDTPTVNSKSLPQSEETRQGVGERVKPLSILGVRP